MYFVFSRFRVFTHLRLLNLNCVQSTVTAKSWLVNVTTVSITKIFIISRLFFMTLMSRFGKAINPTISNLICQNSKILTCSDFKENDSCHTNYFKVFVGAQNTVLFSAGLNQDWTEAVHVLTTAQRFKNWEARERRIVDSFTVHKKANWLKTNATLNFDVFICCQKFKI